MKKEMLINVLQSEECRIAILENGVLEELYVERTSQESYVGNVYKGRIVNIEPSIQAAFVDFGIGRNGFLHVSDVDPAYYAHLEGRRDGPRRDEPRRSDDRPPRREEPRPEGRRPGDRPPRREEPRPEGRRADERPPWREEPPRPTGFEPSHRSAHPPAAPAAEEPDSGFGSGIFDDDILGPEPGPVEQDAPPTRQETAEAPPAEDAPKPKAKAKRTTRSRKKAAEPGTAAEDETLRYMDSAERRTDDEFDDLMEDEVEPASGPFLEAQVDDGDEDFDEDDLENGPPRGRNTGPRGRDDRGKPRRLGRDGNGKPKPLIQDIFKRGQEVIVQVIKEGIGTKGPTLSTYISIAGRYLVLMPGLQRVGVSRKIADDEQRRRLRDILLALKPPAGLGFIIRTAGVERSKVELESDLSYLLRIWQVVAKRIRNVRSPGPIYQESDMITRTIRDTFTNDIDAIYVDEPEAYHHAKEFLQGVMPRYAERLKLYEATEPLFHKYGIEDEIARIQNKKVPLPGGGSIVIEQTEALVAIDVNSGSFRADSQNAEETSYQMNLSAAKEIARQLRLRDLGGVIVNDFIDMKEERHRRGVEKALLDALKRDRARTKVLRISQFGLIEMTRQRIRPSLRRSCYRECPHCSGTGHIKTPESMSIEVMRMLQLAAHREPIRRLEVRVHEEVAEYLQNRKRREISRLEDVGQMHAVITGVPGAPPELMEYACFDVHNNEVKLYPEPPLRQHAGRPPHRGGRN